MKVGDSVLYDYGNEGHDIGIIIQIGNPHGARNIHIEWTVGKPTWEYVADAKRWHQDYLDTLGKP